MKRKLLFPGGLLVLLCATAQAQLAITTNTVAPAIGAYDQYYLPGPVDEATNAMTLDGNANAASDANDVLTYIAGDKASKGQSFTTGSNPSGYTISSVTVRQILWTNFLANGTYMNIPSGSSFDFRFGTISGANISSILDTTATYSGPALNSAGGGGTGIYFTFDLSGAGIGTLSPNTTYFFEIASASVPPYFELHNTRTNATSYTGGTAFYSDTTAALDQSGVVNLPPYGGEFAFVAKLAAVGAPSVVASASPASGLVGQAFTIAATVTPGLGAVTNVSIDLGAIGGSSAANLVLSNANVYTNTFTVPAGASIGTASLTVTEEDNTPLSATDGVLFTVLPSDRTWDGGSLADDKWSSSANWLGDLAPSLSGNNVVFAGTTRLTPDVDANYSVAGMTFSNTAGSFTIGSSTGSTLTIGSGGVANNSASAQTLNVPVVLSAAQTFNAANGLTLSSNVTGGFGLRKTGNGTLTLAGSGASAIGDLTVNNGLVKIDAGTVRVSATQGNTKIDSGGSVEVASGAVLTITNGGNAWFPLGDTAGTTSTLTISGGTVDIVDNWGIEVPRQGSAILNINSGNLTVNDSGGIGLVMGDQATAESGTINLNGGTLTANKITAINGVNAFYFNGGTLKPIGNNANFFPSSGALSAYVRDGGAIVDTSGLNVSIGQLLDHSPVAGDSATDGGLTKIGAGTLTLAGGFYYTGPNKVLGGTLNLNLALGVAGTGSDLVVSNATLILDASSGSSLPAANVVVQAGAALSITNYAYSTAVNGTGNLTLAGGTTINLNYGTLFGGNPTAAAITVAGGFSASETNRINIAGNGFVAGQFPLIDYTGTAVPTNNFVLASLPAGVSAVLTNNADNTSLDLLVTLAGNAISWHGANADNSALLTNWDINTSSNWYDANYYAVRYMQYGGNAYGDLVTFGDNGYNLDGTNSVNLAGRVVPSSVTVENNSYPYTLTGAGGIDGAAAFTKNGANSFLLGTSNNYTGGTFVNAGTLTVNSDSALGAASGLLTMAGGTLQVAGNMASPRLTTLTANTTVDTLTNVTGQLQLNGSVTAGGTLTKAGDGSLVLSGTGVNRIGDLLVGQGMLKITNGVVTVGATQGNSKIDLGGSVEVAVGGVLTITNGGNAWFPLGDTGGTTNTLTVSGGTVAIVDNWGIEAPRNGNAILNINSGSMTVQDSGGIGLILGDQSGSESGTLNLNGGSLVVNRITSNNGTNVFCFNGGTLKPTTNVVNNANFFPNSVNLFACVRNGGAIVDTGGKNVSIGQAINHSSVAGDNAIDGGLTKIGDGTLNLNGVNTYTGPTVINAGGLGGAGTIAGTLANNATLAPGNGGIGTLTVSGNITLNAGSTNTFEVNGTTQTNDVIVAGAGVTYGGTLNIVTNGTFTAGQQFQLFSGSGVASTSNFASITGSPGSGLGFTFTNGVLSVVTASVGPSGPEHLTNSYSAGVLSLSWPAGEGWRLQMQTNDLSAGLSTNWVYLTDGSINSTNITVDSSKPTVFYRLTYP